jgi:predicted deacylase
LLLRRKQFAVYAMPMANKDGVVAGMTRFNLRGEDLNRKWDKPSEPGLAPEKQALEQWLEEMICAGRKPDLSIDFHNDQSGRLHISRPAVEDLDTYLLRMKELETALREHTWFTEGSSTAKFRNPGSIGEGLLQRYGIFALVHELNAGVIAGLDQPASAKHWMNYGANLPEALFAYFGKPATE